jgi:SulP family sulfate permease
MISWVSSGHERRWGDVNSGDRRRINLFNLRQDFLAGLQAAIVALPQTLSLGALVFLPLGPGMAAFGVLAGFVSSIFAGTVAALAGGTHYQVGGPRASVSLIGSAMLLGFASAPGVSPGQAVTLFFLAILLAGLLQVVFGLVRLGNFIKFIPHPVVAGFMNGIALLLFIGQIRPLLGLSGAQPLKDATSLWHPGALIVGLATILLIAAGPRWVKKVPGPILGLLGGVALHHALVFAAGASFVGPVVGGLPAGGIGWGLAGELSGLVWGEAQINLLAQALPNILLLALVSSVDSLMSAAAIDSLSNNRHSSNRELIGQGLSNIVSALLGGVASAGSTVRAATLFRAGARTRAAGVIHALILAALLFGAPGLISLVPMAVMGGMMVMLAFTMIDGWSREMMWRLSGPLSHRREVVANLAVVATVALSVAFLDLLVAVGIGFLASMFLFIAKMSKPIIRRISRGGELRSLKIRAPEQASYLKEHGRRIVLVEMDGPLFFGTSDHLYLTIDQLRPDACYFILDFAHVGEMDATGARILQQIARVLKQNRKHLVLSSLALGDFNAEFLKDMGATRDLAPESWFADSDAALEWCEDRLLAEAFPEERDAGEMRLADMPLTRGFDAAELAALERHLTRRLHDQGTLLFSEGDRGGHLYVLGRGEVSIRLKLGDGRRSRRLAAFGPGVVFGEMALLDNRPRSADAIADRPISLYELAQEDFEALERDHPHLFAKLMRNLAAELAARLRVTSEEVRTLAR